MIRFKLIELIKGRSIKDKLKSADSDKSLDEAIAGRTGDNKSIERNIGFVIYFYIFAATFFLSLTADYVSKKVALALFADGALPISIIDNFFDISFVRNYGVSFGFLSNLKFPSHDTLRYLLVILNIVVVIVIDLYILRKISLYKVVNIDMRNIAIDSVYDSCDYNDNLVSGNESCNQISCNQISNNASSEMILRYRKLIIMLIALVNAGAIGNIMDRLQYGYVIDFIHVFHRDWSFPVFNIADSCIFIGVVGLYFFAFRQNILHSSNAEAHR